MFKPISSEVGFIDALLTNYRKRGDMLTRKPKVGEYLFYRDSTCSELFIMKGTHTATSGNIINILNVRTGKMDCIIWRFCDGLNENITILPHDSELLKEALKAVEGAKKMKDFSNQFLKGR